MARLYIVATPIGNLDDITKRALAILRGVDLILCEDTRVTQKLLNRFGINKPLQSYHQHSDTKKLDYITKILQEGKNIALVSDSGTPGVSDPGNELINKLTNNIESVPIPGPSAVTAITSVAGSPMNKFLFLGFPPHKKGRNKFFEEVAESKCPVILYESPYRIIKTLKQINELLNTKYQTLNTNCVVGRELTKKFETIYRGKISEVIPQIEPRGEFVVIICPANGEASKLKNHEK
jgi:16S rRNA (cytidine1402-2'-O)-methyltransferase